MLNKNIDISGFTLAKGSQLKGDDFFEFKVMDSMSVAVVCDGVGAALKGAEASQRTAKFLVEALKNRPKSWSIEKSIHHFIANINQMLYRESMEDYQREELVTTLALIVIEGDRLYGANVGDSRIYLQRENTLVQLSNDHTADEVGMENVLTLAIGLEESLEPYYFENRIEPKDRLLLCSDGLYNELSLETLNEYLYMGASFLVKKASKRYDDDLPDDTSAVVIDIKEIDLRQEYKRVDLKVNETYHQGELIDGYCLLKPLIQNERTWLCEKRGLKYVIKFIPFEAKYDEVILDLFVKEVWISKQLKAGFFPKAIVPKHRTHRYYIMSYIEGKNLKEFTQKRSLSIDLSVELIHFLLKMAQYLIRNDLVHGDIKPENIMMTKRKGKFVFKMVDFGSITEAYSIVSRAGTPSYVAPERFKNAPINEQTEIYALGATLYELLTQKLPFGEIEPFQNPSFDKKIRPLTAFNSKVPSWLESIILRSLDVDVQKRYNSYSLMQYELKNPNEVKPYFDKSKSFIERNPLFVCRGLLVVMILLNIMQFMRG